MKNIDYTSQVNLCLENGWRYTIIEKRYDSAELVRKITSNEIDAIIVNNLRTFFYYYDDDALPYIYELLSSHKVSLVTVNPFCVHDLYSVRENLEKLCGI